MGELKFETEKREGKAQCMPVKNFPGIVICPVPPPPPGKEFRFSVSWNDPADAEICEAFDALSNELETALEKKRREALDKKLRAELDKRLKPGREGEASR